MDNGEDYVADSEEELSMDPGILNAITNWTGENAAREAEGATMQLLAGEPSAFQGLSSISDFSAKATGGNTSTEISGFTTPSTRPRPRPRPIPPKKPASEVPVDASSNISAFSLLDRAGNASIQNAARREIPATFDDDVSDFPGMSSIADRAKTRQRKTDPSTAKQQWDESGFDAPQRTTKSKRKRSVDRESRASKSSKSKGKAKSSDTVDVIELTDDEDEDELNLRAKSKATLKVSSVLPNGPHTVDDTVKKPPRPRPRPKLKKPSVNDEQPSDEAALRPRSTPPPPPPATDLPSSSRNHTRTAVIPSSLPPSDPPLPTSQGSIMTTGAPRIAFLPDPSGSVRPAAAHDSAAGRKLSSEIDELFSGDDDDLFADTLLARPESKDPSLPPTFFAPSSPNSSARGTAGRPGKPAAQDSPIIPTDSLQRNMDAGRMDVDHVDPPLAKGKRKKKALDDDEADEDWGAESSKPKEKKASKKKKVTKKVVEVLIETTPESVARDAAAAKKKTKKKGKDPQGEAKEVFKSKELIEDSDEDPLLAPPPPETLRIAPSSDARSSSSKSGAGSKDGQTEDSLPAGDPERQDVFMEDEEEEFPVARTKSRKKRKPTEVEDDEDFGDQRAPAVEESSNKPKKRRKDDQSKSNKGDSSSKTKPSKNKGPVILSEEEEEEEAGPKLAPTHEGEGAERNSNVVKETVGPPAPSPSPPETSKQVEAEIRTPQPAKDRPRGPRHSLTSRIKATPMSELIKRVNSQPNSPFPSAPSTSRVPAMSKIATSYSPYLKSSRSLLSKIAPLHPNRRTPPPPLPPPPPRRKTKKELEREEKWEEEMVESVGIEAWAAMTDAERRDMRKAKFEAEMGGWD